MDESQSIKNSSSQQSTNVLFTLKQLNPKYLFLLTGTPMPSRTTELYTQLKLLSPAQIKNKNIFYKDICQMYYNPKTYSYEYLEEPTFENAFKKMDSIMFRVRKKDVLKDLPELLINEMYINISDNEYKTYSDIEKGILNFDLNNFKTNKADENLFYLTIFQKLRQFTASLKVKELVEIIKRHNEEGQKVIVFDDFKSTINYLHNEFLNSSVKFTGEISVDERNKNVNLFQNDDNIKNIFLTTQAGNAGLTLNKASFVYMISENYVPSINDQCYARAHRIGQLSTVNAVNLIISDTIDEHVNVLIKNKRKEINKVIDNEEFIDNFKKISIVDELINILYEKTKNKED
jgi:SNF2 family DNA or RNA helicase